MKKIIIVALLALMPSALFSQSVFDKFDGREAVTTVIVNKKMFEMIGKMKMDAKDKETQQYLELVKKLTGLKVFTTNNKKISGEMKSTVDGYLKSTALEELMRVTEAKNNVRIYVKSGANVNTVKELLMFIEGDGETVLMSLTGNFLLDDLSVLTDKMNLPGGNELKKASKK